MMRWLLTCALLLIAPSALAAPPTPLLWKAQGESATVYLLGSFHLLRADDYPLDPAVEAAYAQAERMAFEIDPAEMADPSMVQTVQKLARFSDERRLSDVISADTAKKLRQFLGSDAAMTASEPFKPWYMGLNISVGMMVMTGLDVKLGLDQHFMQRAVKDGKIVAGLETAMEQMSALDGSPMDEQAHMLDEALEPAADTRKRILELHALWRAGDAEGLEKAVNEDMRDNTPIMYERLNRNRNRAWLPQIVALVHGKQTALVVVGSMHLLGADGLVELLRAHGIKVDRVASAPIVLDKAA
ncbi:MAG: TraB/GumN family protein [Xanthomonadales bacterium]|nr:TraB/GumN family protein [Xanthomonadales bacterium]